MSHGICLDVVVLGNSHWLFGIDLFGWFFEMLFYSVKLNLCLLNTTNNIGTAQGACS